MSETIQNTPFSTLLAQVAAQPDGSSLTVTEDWAQGRTLFGGISAALCAATGERLAGEGIEGAPPPLRSAQVAFIGPAAGDLRLSGEVLRRGKSVTFVQADLHAEGKLATRAILTYGAARQSTIDDETLVMPAVPQPEDCVGLHPPSGGPGFTRNFDIRSADPAFSLRRRDEARQPSSPDLKLWARHKDPAAGAGGPALLAMADVPPPAAIRLMTAWAPISSMTWMVDVLNDPLEGDDGWRFLHCFAEVTRHGYSSQAMALWDRNGRPLAIGRQNIAVFS